MAQAKVSKAKALRAEARAALAAEGKPIPASLQKGTFTDKVVKKMPEAIDETDTKAGGVTDIKTKEASVKSKIKVALQAPELKGIPGIGKMDSNALFDKEAEIKKQIKAAQLARAKSGQ